VGTNPTVETFALIAVVAKDLESGREIVLNYPKIETNPTSVSNLFAVCITVVVDVIDSQKELLSFATTCTNIAAIRTENSVLDSRPVFLHLHNLAVAMRMIPT
jgi:hypothetical protein